MKQLTSAKTFKDLYSILEKSSYNKSNEQNEFIHSFVKQIINVLVLYFPNKHVYDEYFLIKILEELKDILDPNFIINYITDKNITYLVRTFNILNPDLLLDQIELLISDSKIHTDIVIPVSIFNYIFDNIITADVSRLEYLFKDHYSFIINSINKRIIDRSIGQVQINT